MVRAYKVALPSRRDNISTMRFSSRLLLCALVVTLLLCVQLVLGGAAPGLQQRDHHDRLLLLPRATTSTEPERAGRDSSASASATPTARVSGGDRASSSSRPSKTGDSSTPSAASNAPLESGICMCLCPLFWFFSSHVLFRRSTRFSLLGPGPSH